MNVSQDSRGKIALLIHDVAAALMVAFVPGMVNVLIRNAFAMPVGQEPNVN